MKENAKAFPINEELAVPNYGNGTFRSYDALKAYYMKETFSTDRYNRKGYFEKHVNYDDKKPYVTVAPEEIAGFKHIYRNQGLFPKSAIGYLSHISFYGSHKFC